MDANRRHMTSQSATTRGHRRPTRGHVFFSTRVCMRAVRRGEKGRTPLSSCGRGVQARGHDLSSPAYESSGEFGPVGAVGAGRSFSMSVNSTSAGAVREGTPVMPPTKNCQERSDHPISRPLSHCPGCGSVRLDPVVERGGETVHLLCRDCSRCWHVELGFVHRMDPTACFGCPERTRCEAAYEADHRATET
jgi:hypothetical protein